MESMPNGKNVHDDAVIRLKDVINLNPEELKAYLDTEIRKAVEDVLN